ncbi:MAG: hypothetical protein PHQ11_06040 [Paludibacter sp.]|nr:hypothetical protein [Paludibacter sp.]MDD4199116.1 hypothetical protein [Paludibacter sp.]MDD4428267.1 hypothetical protein [Paludibacter sp.]
MKTNIIHVLIVAIILVVGFSVFTIIQDISSSGDIRYDKDRMLVVGKQYLPKTPDNYANQTKFPVYKGANRNKLATIKNKVKNPGTLEERSSFEITTNYSNYNATGGIMVKNKAIVASGRKAENVHVDYNRHNFISSNIATPFSKNVSINSERSIADASLEGSNLAGGGMLQGSDAMLKAFGGDDEGDDFEIGGGTENEDFYNDVPVGDGLYIMLMLALIYAFIKVRKYNMFQNNLN